MFRQQGPGVGGVVPYQPHVQQVQIKTRGHDAGGRKKIRKRQKNNNNHHKEKGQKNKTTTDEEKKQRNKNIKETYRWLWSRNPFCFSVAMVIGGTCSAWHNDEYCFESMMNI